MAGDREVLRPPAEGAAAGAAAHRRAEADRGADGHPARDRRSRCTWRATTAPPPRDPDNADLRRHLRCCCRAAGPRASTARSCATRRSPPPRAGFNGFPGEKYPSLFTFYGVTTPGHTPDEIGERHPRRDRSPEDRRRAGRRAAVGEDARRRRTCIRGLASNSGLALQLASYQTLYGDWRELFREVERIDKVTAADVKRVANSDVHADEPHRRRSRIGPEEGRAEGRVEMKRLALTPHSPSC